MDHHCNRMPFTVDVLAVGWCNITNGPAHRWHGWVVWNHFSILAGFFAGSFIRLRFFGRRTRGFLFICDIKTKNIQLYRVSVNGIEWNVYPVLCLSNDFGTTSLFCECEGTRYEIQYSNYFISIYSLLRLKFDQRSMIFMCYTSKWLFDWCYNGCDKHYTNTNLIAETNRIVKLAIAIYRYFCKQVSILFFFYFVRTYCGMLYTSYYW